MNNVSLINELQANNLQREVCSKTLKNPLRARSTKLIIAKKLSVKPKYCFRYSIPGRTWENRSGRPRDR